MQGWRGRLRNSWAGFIDQFARILCCEDYAVLVDVLKGQLHQLTAADSSLGGGVMVSAAFRAEA